jgi:hypothetical protein
VKSYDDGRPLADDEASRKKRKREREQREREKERESVPKPDIHAEAATTP